MEKYSKALYCTFVAPVNCVHQKKIKVQYLSFSLLINLDRIIMMFFSIHLWPERVIELSYTIFVVEYEMQKYCFFHLLNYFLKLKHCKGFHGFIRKCQYPFLGYKSNRLKYEGTFKVFSDQSLHIWSSALVEKIHF